jgi:small subunit ribosomal protein S17
MARTITGTVSSNKADKTIVVTVVTRKTHPLYKKQYSVTDKYMAHDEKNVCVVGDKVLIAETRPLSARKRFVLVKVIEKTAIREEDTVDAITAEPTIEEPKQEEAPKVTKKVVKKPAKVTKKEEAAS